MTQLSQIVDTLNHVLNAAAFRDFCPNGLQIEGQHEVHNVVTGVTASQALIDAAIAADAQAIIVHHGIFWRGDPYPITGVKKQRIASLLAHRIALLAWHLPLDAHPTLGNNAGLAQAMGWHASDEYFGEHNLGWLGKPQNASVQAGQLAAQLGDVLQRPPLFIGEPEQEIKRLAWCTGGAQSFFPEAIDAGADAFITGEASEQVTHLAREHRVAFFAAGHHATERFGVRNLADYLEQNGLAKAQFIDIDNPV